MRNKLALIALFSLPTLAAADVLTLPAASDAAATVVVPGKGESQVSVLRAFGEPLTRHAPVGGEAPTHPPITRWDYAGFSVFFERAHVVDAVVPGQPAPVYHTDTLTPSAF